MNNSLSIYWKSTTLSALERIWHDKPCLQGVHHSKYSRPRNDSESLKTFISSFKMYIHTDFLCKVKQNLLLYSLDCHKGYFEICTLARPLYLRLRQVFCFPFQFSRTYPLQLSPTSWLFLWHFVTVLCSSSLCTCYFLLARTWSTKFSHLPLLGFLSIWVKNISTSLSQVFK